MKYKKGVFIIYHSNFKWETFWGKLKHILKVIFNKPFIIMAIIDAKDIKEFKRI